MTDSPWLRWPVAILALLWHLVAVTDYLLTKFQAPFYLAWFTPDQLTYFTALPVWVDAGWALAAWSGLLGALLLAWANRNAALFFALAFAGLLAVSIWLYYLSDPPAAVLSGQIGIRVIAGALVADFLLYLYARSMRVRQRRV